MYRKYWGLTERPFGNNLAPHFLFYGREHEEALVRLLYTVSESKGMMLFTGESGLGKSYLCHSFRRELSTKGYRVAMIENPADGRLEILRQIDYEFGLAGGANGSKAALVGALKEFAQENLAEGNDTVIILDEAHTLQDEATWEEVRLLHNFRDEGRFLLTLILVGQTRLKKLIKRFPDLAHRIGVSFTLRGLSETETHQYIDHRMRIAGCDREVFTANALREIHAFSGGIPLKINNVCDLALLVACSQRSEVVTPAVVQEAVEELVEFAGYSRETP
ncbi:MAG: AAA family ATPase [Planctomycetes bacterium]|nr:AAA family ATPase [Planctomycetota bacterium]